MKKWKICDHIPPWADAHNQRCLYWSLIVTAIVCSAALYFPLLRMTHNDLSYSDQTMVYFADIVGSQGDLGGWYSQAVLSPFLLLIPGAVVLAVYNYAKLWQGAKSIYLMGRLPDRWELHRRCLTLPLGWLLSAVLLPALTLLVYYGIYYLITPAACLRPNQLAKLLENLPYLFNPFFPHPGAP